MLGPATHRADAKATYIHPLDDAWDTPRIKAERKAIALRNVELAVGLDDEAKGRIIRAHRHPVDVYYAGATRYDLDAPLRLFRPGTVGDDGLRGDDQYVDVTVRGYLVGDSPTTFAMERLEYETWRDLMADLGGRAAQAAQLGKRSLEECWALTILDRERATQALERACVEGTKQKPAELYKLAADLPSRLGNAVMVLSGPPQEHELFPYA